LGEKSDGEKKNGNTWVKDASRGLSISKREGLYFQSIEE